jgi:signal transduction histidine kinase
VSVDIPDTDLGRLAERRADARAGARERSEPAAATAEPEGVAARAVRGPNFDRVLFVRHLAIFVGAVVAYYQHARHGIGWAAFGIVTASAALNFACSFLHRRPRFAPLAEVASSVIGVGCWTALAAVTGGVPSPFIAGLWLEIVLAAMLFALAGIVSVTLWSVAALWGLQIVHGLEGAMATLLLQTAFLIGMGSFAYAAARNALRTEADLVRERDALDVRLRSLADELEQQRNVGRLGGNVARLAHGLKNAVHSLRGFAALIEPTVGERRDAQAALAGLRVAIDDLESLARMTLEEGSAPRPADSRAAVGVALERALREMRVAHADVEWTIEGDADAPVALAPADLCEVLVILMRNAVEAMGGQGRAAVKIGREGDQICVAVRDQGAGIAPVALERIFEPGFTTKPQGSGYGLFLARRLVTEAGGRIAARAAQGGGAEIEIALPVALRSSR